MTDPVPSKELCPTCHGHGTVVGKPCERHSNFNCIECEAMANAPASESLADLLTEGRQWAASLRGIYLHRGNQSMALQVAGYLQKIDALFPPDPNAPLAEVTPPPENRP